MLGFGRKKKKPVKPALPRWDDRASLVAFSPVDHWTIGDSFEGVQIFGSTGSGKTSGSGAAIAKEMLRAGYGGLVLTAKGDEPDLWRRYCADTGRSDSLIMFGPDHGYAFNFLEYERSRGRGGGSTENIAELLLEVRRIIRRGASAGGSIDPFWDDSQQALLRNSIDLLLLANEPLSLSGIDALIDSAPAEPVTWETLPTFVDSYCLDCLRKATRLMESVPSEDPRQATLDATGAYWLRKLPRIPEKTKQTIATMFDGTADGFLRGDMRRLFCAGTNILPELTFEGAVLVIDMPVKRHHDLGRAAQIIWKLMWQRALEARDLKRNNRPVFLWADEAQNFITARDSQFQATARASRASTVYLTQNISSYYAAIGGVQGGDAKAATDAFVGNLQTIIFHANADAVTNKWAQEHFSERWNWRGGVNRGGKAGDQQTGSSYQLYRDPAVLASRFHSLRRGGHRDRGVVDAIVTHAARSWNASGQPAMLTHFYQREPSPSNKKSRTNRKT